MSRPAVFLDRDGTITDEVGYVNHVSRLRVMPAAARGIRRLNDAGVPVVVVTNQAGAARGYFPASLIDEVHAELHRQLAETGAHLDGLYFCPHHPSSKDPALGITCACRKPKTGLVDQACRELDLDAATSFVVGDKYSDVELGHRVRGKGILVLTGYGLGEVAWFGSTWPTQPDCTAKNLDEAVDYILAELDRYG